ncbi:MAG: ABC transporter permease [Endomicrobiaceae bacterium]|nr:ABC transporter permease [Endomicrobiaceae bacterium]MDD4165721.1 ABC transporter permease [Endomicrobiaceae bacterium]
MNKFKRYRLMVWELAFSDFRMRDQGTALGFLWTLLYPLIFFFILYTIFADWMKAIKDFPLYLLIGMVQWGFFAGATTATITAIIRYSNFIKSISFPKECIVFASVLAVMFSHFFELIILIIFLFIIKGYVTVYVFFLIPLLLLTLYLIAGFSLLLSLIGVYFADMTRIWSLLTTMGFFVTPIFYSVDMLSPTKQYLIYLNPMTHIIQATRELLLDCKIPQLDGLLYVFIMATVLIVVGYILFKKFEGYFVEKIQ